MMMGWKNQRKPRNQTTYNREAYESLVHHMLRLYLTQNASQRKQRIAHNRLQSIADRPAVPFSAGVY